MMARQTLGRLSHGAAGGAEGGPDHIKLSYSNLINLHYCAVGYRGGKKLLFCLRACQG